MNNTHRRRVKKSRREPLDVRRGVQTRGSAGTTPHAQVNTPTELRDTKAKANCRFCGEPWFGDVAYCPYCSHQSASAPASSASAAAPETDMDASSRADSACPVREGVPHAFEKPTLATVRSGPTREPTDVAAASAVAAEATAHALANYLPTSAGMMPSQPAEVHPYAETMRSSADAMCPGAPEVADAEQGMGWKPVALATMLAAVLFALGELAVTASAGPEPQAAVRAAGGEVMRVGTFKAGAGVDTSAPAVPRADAAPPAGQVPMLPAPDRTLCSAANEAAGLCSSQ